MKFLCVACDEPMKLRHTGPPDERGSLSVLYRCPRCEYEMAMLTNPHETQVVGSLGVRLGAGAAERAEEGGCPFSEVVRQAEAGVTAGGGDAGGIPWTAAAAARLQNIPEFVRPMAKMGVEKFAADNGHTQVDEKVLDEAREVFGM